MAVKWGVLGTANIARGCTIPGMKKAGNCELYAIAGRNEEKVRSFKEEFGFVRSNIGYETLIGDPDVQAVYIPLPNHLHKEWVIKALRAGKHVLCEKPLALNARDAWEMFGEAKANGVLLMEAYAYQHSPYVASLKADVRSGLIGKVDYIETAFLTRRHEEDIRLYKDMGGGALYDLGCYCTTMILSLLDSQPEYVKAVAEFGAHDVDLLTAAIMKFEDGARAAFTVGMILDPGADTRKDRLYVHGSKGYINSDVEYNQAGTLSYTVVSGGEKIVRTVEAPQNYTLEVEQLGRCIEGQETPLVTEAFSLRNAELMDMILKEIGY